jgi:SAM-dependent methyltransferase
VKGEAIRRTIIQSRIRSKPVNVVGIEVFDREAARYDAWFESERGRALFASEVSCLQHLVRGLPRPWLEVGVGTGRFAQALDIDVGVDLAPAALRYAVGRGIRGLTARGEALPFGDGSFGTVFIIVTLCFARDPAALLHDARRVVGEGGSVVLGIVPAGSPWGRSYRQKADAGHTFYSQARFFTLAELKQLAGGAELRLERSASTLFQEPGRDACEVEPPREGESEDESAGFVAMLFRPALDRGRKDNG